MDAAAEIVCKFIIPTGRSRVSKSMTGPSSCLLPQIEFEDAVNRKFLWCDPWAPGLEFGAATMFFADVAGCVNISSSKPPDHLWLLLTNNYYIDITKYERVGNPPMLTILNPPADWTLEHGVLRNGNRNSVIKISSRSKT